MSLSLVRLFRLHAVAVYILDMAEHNICGKSILYLKIVSHFLMHQLKQAVDNHAKTGCRRAQLRYFSLALPEGAHIPQPFCHSSLKLGGGSCVLQGQQGRHGHSCTPCLCWKVQSPTNTRGGHWASEWLAARQRQPCFSSPCSCPSGSHSLSVS